MKKPRSNFGMQGLRSEKEKYSIFSLARNAFTHHENWAQAWKSPDPKTESKLMSDGTIKKKLIKRLCSSGNIKN